MSDIRIAILTLLIVTGIPACVGTRMSSNPESMIELENPIVSQMDDNVSVKLDWIIVRDGPGTWAKNAVWDEYLIRFENLTNRNLDLLRVTVVDSLDHRTTNANSLGELRIRSDETVERYKKNDIVVSPGRGVSIAALTAGATLGTSVAIGGWTGFYIAGLGIIGAIVAIPALGITSTYNAIAVNKELESRTTTLPTTVLANTETTFHFFFPYAPSPKYVELIYTDTAGEHSLILDTEVLLDGLNLER